MIQRSVVLLLILGFGGSGTEGDPPPFPKQVPPVLGTAVVTETGQNGELSEWRISLTVPKIRWEVVGEMVPKKQWPELKAEVDKTTVNLRMGGPSQLRESRFVDLTGKELSRDQVIRRLAKETPVLVSVSDTMPEPYYLQLTNADTLIVILGPRDGYPAPELLPAEKRSTEKPPEGDKK